MHVETGHLLELARSNSFAVGAFNIYNLEGASAVIAAAEDASSPVILQLLPSAIALGGSPLIAMCLEMARRSSVPVGVHLDHCPEKEIIRFVLASGLTSIMADGSSLNYEDNLAFTREIAKEVKQHGGSIEAELGKLSGEEDGLSIAQWEEQLTDPRQAAEFVDKTGISALAVCIGNVHGKYHKSPELDFERLAAIASEVSIPLVLHGSSGLGDELIERSIELGVSKFNVNTEVRNAYINAMSESFATSSRVELVELMHESITAMQKPVQAKIELFCSANKASLYQL